ANTAFDGALRASGTGIVRAPHHVPRPSGERFHGAPLVSRGNGLARQHVELGDPSRYDDRRCPAPDTAERRHGARGANGEPGPSVTGGTAVDVLPPDERSLRRWS